MGINFKIENVDPCASSLWLRWSRWHWLRSLQRFVVCTNVTNPASLACIIRLQIQYYSFKYSNISNILLSTLCIGRCGSSSLFQRDQPSALSLASWDCKTNIFDLFTLNTEMQWTTKGNYPDVACIASKRRESTHGQKSWQYSVLYSWRTQCTTRIAPDKLCHLFVNPTLWTTRFNMFDP